jgi:photosystem II stability/assembly factor-like uncharacterized protein
MQMLRGWMSAFLVFVVLVFQCAITCAGDAPEEKGKWTVISDKLVSSTPVPPDFNGLPGKTLKTTGVAVDRTTGAVIVVLMRSQIFRSTDKGKTFERIDGGKVSGICQTGWSINLDPDNGKRMACFLIYGMGGLTLDGGKTWKQFPGNFDFGAVDWSAAEPQVMLGIDHGGRLNLTKDAGKTWKLSGTDRESRESGSSVGVGVVDSGTLLVHRKKGSGIERSTDDGETWTKVSDLNPKSAVAVVFKDAVYWVGAEGLIVSKDKGKTWQLQGTSVDAIMGPFFGKDEKHIVVVGLKGFAETTDGGKTWKNVMSLAGLEAELDPNTYYHSNKCPVSWRDNFAWDPMGNVFYHSRMTDSVRKYER